MKDIYSPALAVSMACTVAAVLAGFLGRRERAGGRKMPWTAARILWLSAVLVLATSLISHLNIGHAPGSGEALDALDFVAVHPAPFVTAACLVIIAGAHRVLSKRQ